MLTSARIVTDLVHGLRNLRNSEAFSAANRELHSLENQSDTVYRRGLSNLFNAPGVDPIFVLKWKEVYERMEMAVDKCEDVANVIEGVALEYA